MQDLLRRRHVRGEKKVLKNAVKHYRLIGLSISSASMGSDVISDAHKSAETGSGRQKAQNFRTSRQHTPAIFRYNLSDKNQYL
jgi:hypothetical protein